LPDQPLAPRIDRVVTDERRDAAELATRIDNVTRGAARAAVLAVNDGLVTNVSLIIAMFGADASLSAVRLAGFASLVAGAFSMAAGEWISVRSQVDLYRGVLGDLRALVIRNPRLVLGELTTKLEEAGFGTETAQRASTELPLDSERFFAFTARTVFGVNPDELGSPWVAASTSLGLFTLGALVPLVPWFVTSGGTAAVISVVSTAVAAMAVGGWVSRSAGNPPARGAARQLAIVIAATAVTYAVGAVLGTAVA
jgi:vacuolar iron transporter family protein